MTLNLSPSPSGLSDQQTSPPHRLTPLCGVAFFLLLMASAVIAGETPSEKDSGANVLSLFKAHEGAEKVSSLLAALSVVFLVFFTGRLYRHLVQRGAGTTGSVVFGGALLLAVGGAARAGVGWALATDHGDLDPGAAQALNVLFNGHYPAVVGIAVFMFASCLSIVRTRALPVWLGCAALPIGILAIAPPSLIPLIGAGVWIAVAGIVMTVRGDRVSDAV